jgi:hypothetical protein
MLNSIWGKLVFLSSNWYRARRLSSLKNEGRGLNSLGAAVARIELHGRRAEGASPLPKAAVRPGLAALAARATITRRWLLFLREFPW